MPLEARPGRGAIRSQLAGPAQPGLSAPLPRNHLIVRATFAGARIAPTLDAGRIAVRPAVCAGPVEGIFGKLAPHADLRRSVKRTKTVEVGGETYEKKYRVLVRDPNGLGTKERKKADNRLRRMIGRLDGSQLATLDRLLSGGASSSRSDTTFAAADVGGATIFDYQARRLEVAVGAFDIIGGVITARDRNGGSVSISGGAGPTIMVGDVDGNISVGEITNATGVSIGARRNVSVTNVSAGGTIVQTTMVNGRRVTGVEAGEVNAQVAALLRQFGLGD
ncbi:MAG: hypothetical protein IT371_11920 [Deltaproteobacteria bacterium]|nr:hypothetical protein [Deltaproteobacteria bacterium]